MKSDMSVVVFSSSAPKHAPTQRHRLDTSQGGAFSLGSGPAEKKYVLAQMLADYGWRALTCTEPAEAYRCIRQVSNNEAGMASPALIILTDLDVRSRTVVSCVRALFPETGILLMHGTGAESELVSCFQLGVDAWAPETASVELLVAMLLGLARRQTVWKATAAKITVNTAVKAPGRWVLDEHGWMLISPDGTGIPLTTAERAFLVALLSAPDQKASRDQLIHATRRGESADQADKEYGRLGVMVSRLRRKAEKSGLVLPLRSLYRWGYMFTGAV